MTTVTISAIKEEILKQNPDLTEKQVEFMPISIRLFGTPKEEIPTEEGNRETEGSTTESTVTEASSISINSENGIAIISLS